MDLALGLIETKGLIGAIEAADAMVKAADVEIIGLEKVTGALMIVKVKGETAAVKAAVDAASVASQRVGQLVSAHVIPRPDNQIDALLFDNELLRKRNELNISDKTLLKKKDSYEKIKDEKLKINESKSLKTKENTENETAIHPKISGGSAEKSLEKIDKKQVKIENTNFEKKLDQNIKIKIPLMEELEVLNVHSLRRIARGIDIFPIKGREISKANRAQLLDLFKKIQ